MNKDKSYKRAIRNYNRYLYYSFEAKNTLKLIKKLEKDFDNQTSQTDQFLNQLIRLCDCKRDNVLLRTLANDISNVSSEFKKINLQHKDKFANVVAQLIQISKQFDGLDEIKNKLKQAHSSRIKYENRSKGLFYLIASAFSITPQQTDYNLSSNLKNDYLDNYTGKQADRKLAKLINDENSLEENLVSQCLNQELAIVIRIRKLVKMFAENQVEYERDLITLFSQLDLVTERDVNEGILGLNDKELEDYFRPKRRAPALPFFYSPGSQIDDEIKSPKPIEKRTNLYYGSLCSLNEKNDKNEKLGKKADNQTNPACQYCSLKLNQESNNLDTKINAMNYQNIQTVQVANEPTGQNLMNLAHSQNSSTNMNLNLKELKSAYQSTSFHKCKQNHAASNEKNNPEDNSTKDAIHNFIYVALKKAADAAKSSKAFQSSFTNPANPTNSISLANQTNEAATCSLPNVPVCPPNVSNVPVCPSPKAQAGKSLADLKPIHQTSALVPNQKLQTYCDECSTHHLKVEQAALDFLNKLRSFESKVKQCSKEGQTTKRF